MNTPRRFSLQEQTTLARLAFLKIFPQTCGILTSTFPMKLALPIASSHTHQGFICSSGVIRAAPKNVWTPKLHDAYQWFVEAANKGDAEAQYQLAWRLTMGWGIGIDIKEARQWYVRAAAQGHKTAKADLETLDEEGEEALYKSKDGMTAAAGHEEKYGDGDPRADILYKQGMECINNELPFIKNLWTPELKQAATLFERAALSGHSEAQYKMGLWLENGWGVGPDWDAALKWYQKASAQGHTEATAARRRLAKDIDTGYADQEAKIEESIRDEIPSFARAQEEGVAAWHAPAAPGLDNSTPLVGPGARPGGRLPGDAPRPIPEAKNGQDFDRKQQEGKSGGDESAPDCDPDAEFALGMACVKDKMPHPDCRNIFMPNLTAASKHFRRAAVQGHAEAQYNLGRWLEGGWGVLRDPESANEWYSKAAAQGHEAAASAMAAT